VGFTTEKKSWGKKSGSAAWQHPPARELTKSLQIPNYRGEEKKTQGNKRTPKKPKAVENEKAIII
jgi:hypothetical protein